MIISWGPGDQAVMEAKIAAAIEVENAKKAEEERKAAEQKKILDDYQASLAQAIAAGNAFQGVWVYSSERGEVGFAIESVAANGLSCAGYLFDPDDRFQRKPFTGVVNREHEAQNALVLKATSGKGINISNPTTMQNHWLRANLDYAVTLKLKDNGWTGKAGYETTLDVTPVPNFAELLAQDQEAENKRQETVRTAVAPGSAWKGAVKGSTNFELGIYFESGQGSQVKGYIFDPENIDARKGFTGTVSYVRYAEIPLDLTMDKSGLKSGNDPRKLYNDFLVDNNTYKLVFTEVGDLLRGKTGGGGWSLELKPLADFAALLEQEAEAEKKRQEAVSPGAEYQGAWQIADKIFHGNIGLKMLTLNDTGETLTAALFDPAEPEVTWTYRGNISKKEGGRQLDLAQAKGNNAGTFVKQEGSTQQLLHEPINPSYCEAQFTLTDEGVMTGYVANYFFGKAATTLKRIDQTTSAPAAQTPPAPSQTAAPAPAPDPAASTPAPAPAPAAQAPAPPPSIPQAVGPASYPPLTPDSAGKAKAAAHFIRLENGTVELALQVLAPGTNIEAVRIDNLGGVKSLWRSDGKDGGAPLAVSQGGARLSTGTTPMVFNPGNTESLLYLSLKDNGAFAGKATEFRVTVFFVGGDRIMCELKTK
jgi:hypothetical protein